MTWLKHIFRLKDNKVFDMEEYAVSSEDPISLKDLLAVYGRAIGEPLPVKWGGRPYRSREVMAPWNKSERFSGWKPKVGLIDGIKMMEKHRIHNA